MRIASIALATFLAALCSPAFASGKAKHVVVMVWDGMRPDFVSETNTPALYQLARRGVTFQNHHPVYISTTEVNGTSLSTGCYPEHDGIVGNREYRPAIEPRKPIHTEAEAVVRRGDELTHGHYVHMATLAEIVRKAGRKTAVAGAKGVALLLDRAERTNAEAGAAVYAGLTLPQSLAGTLAGRYGAFPMLTAAIPPRNDWTSLALIDSLWADGVPSLSFLWMNEPDRTQHLTGPGTEQSLAAIRNDDDNLARVLRALDEKGVRDSTDVLVVSDHGFSTVAATVSLAAALTEAGIKAETKFATTPSRGDVLVVGNGGTAFVYVIDHDENTITRVVSFLQSWTNTGVIFTSKPMPGTFTSNQARLDSSDASDVAVSLRWSAEKSAAGAPGMLTMEVGESSGEHGNHGSLSRFDMHNTLIAAGPDFRPGVFDALPSGNVDVAPTVLWILGIKPPARMDGRVLTEALTSKGPKIKSFEPFHLEATNEIGNSVWHQYLNFTEVNGVRYFDEGNGWQTAK